MQMRNPHLLNEVILKEKPIQEEITNNSSELLQTFKEIRIEMETVKKENERILRAQRS